MRQIQSVNKRHSICQEPTPIRLYTRHRRKFDRKGTTFFRLMQIKMRKNRNFCYMGQFEEVEIS